MRGLCSTGHIWVTTRNWHEPASHFRTWLFGIGGWHAAPGEGVAGSGHRPHASEIGDGESAGLHAAAIQRRGGHRRSAAARDALPSFGSAARIGRSGPCRLRAGKLRAAPELRWLGYLSTIGVYGDLGGGMGGRGNARAAGHAPRPSAARSRSGVVCACPRALPAARHLPPRRHLRAGPQPHRPYPSGRRQAHRQARPGLQPHPCGRHRANRCRRDLPAARRRRNAPVQRRRRRACAAARRHPPCGRDCSALPPPPEIPFEAADLSPMARSFYTGNKRMRNDKIKRELGVALKYPTYREGLRALAQGHRARGRQVSAQKLALVTQILNFTPDCIARRSFSISIQIIAEGRCESFKSAAAQAIDFTMEL